MTHPADDAAASPGELSSDVRAFLDTVDCSLTAELNADPEATADGRDHRPREVRSGHFVPVAPTPIADPAYVGHGHGLFRELGLADSLAADPHFRRIFSGDLAQAPPPLHRTGWATGYALSIYGTEYTQQCPFGTGNGYGDGRAISVCEVVRDGRRWEMQLKGAGPTPYCRGGDGRAVLRSSVREFLAQELMHALGVPTSRSLSLYASETETVMRPWYAPGSLSFDPDVMMPHRVAISTRVAPSFLRVGQLELFARRARRAAHSRAHEELRMIVGHAIEREYRDTIDASSSFGDQVLAMATQFRGRLTALVANWIRVGYCQGNFNSDNTAIGGFTLDYGPFGFCEAFDPHFQPWTGGGEHFSLFNQPAAAEANFRMFCRALEPLLAEETAHLDALNEIRTGFRGEMEAALKDMWARKLGLTRFDAGLFAGLVHLMVGAKADYTLCFRILSDLPTRAEVFERSFHEAPTDALRAQWQAWLDRWHATPSAGEADPEARVAAMKQTNPKYTWREWLVAPAYQLAEGGDYALVRELQTLFREPYRDQAGELAARSDRTRPAEVEGLGGIAHYSCSS